MMAKETVRGPGEGGDFALELNCVTIVVLIRLGFINKVKEQP
jgi:hypothetical protein